MRSQNNKDETKEEAYDDCREGEGQGGERSLKGDEEGTQKERGQKHELEKEEVRREEDRKQIKRG